MVRLHKITCVICPHSGEHVAVSDCFKCPYFEASVGRILDCGYEDDRLKPEPSTIEEPVSRWD